MSIRNTARQLNLHSDSSYRFERGVDPEGVDWASRRCCELILDLAGGELAEGVVDVGPQPAAASSRSCCAMAELKRILGIEVDPDRVRGDPRRAGHCGDRGRRRRSRAVVPPSWRRDLYARDRPGRRGRPDPRLRADPRGRARAHGPFGPQPRGPRAGQGPAGAGGRRLRRSADAQRGRRSDLGRLQPLDRCPAAGQPDCRCSAGPIACGGAWSPACWAPGEPTSRWPTRRSSCSRSPRSTCRVPGSCRWRSRCSP